MSYIGKQPGFGIRNRYLYTATAAQTTFSGADDNGQTLAYADSKYLDVYLNGVLLVAGTDYTATTLTSVSLTTGAAASDIVEIVAYDIFSVADTVSAANGGTFSGAVTFDAGLNTDTISEETSATGVTIDGVLLKDNDIEATDGTFSGGVYLGGTGAANYLNDYEEGTFTVTTNSDPTGVISGEDGFYVKIGKMVFIRIIFSVGTNFTNSAVGGLPFNVKDQSTVSALGWNGVSIDSSASAIFVNAEEATTKIQLYVSGDLTNAHTPSTSGGTYRISVMYQTD